LVRVKVEARVGVRFGFEFGFGFGLEKASFFRSGRFFHLFMSFVSLVLSVLFLVGLHISFLLVLYF
jgi:hypothetical protein